MQLLPYLSFHFISFHLSESHSLTLTNNAHRYTSFKSTPLVPKYLYELMSVMQIFPAAEWSRWNILEIGGAYGGFASTVFHHMGSHVNSYTIVDLEPVCGVALRHMAVSGSKATGRVKCVYSTEGSDAIVEDRIDLLVSFFSVSEQKKEVVDKYLSLYVSKSFRGYLQLNYDENVREGGRSDFDAVDVDRYSAMELFREIYKIKSDAVMRGPSPCGVYKHHRITWG